MGLTVSHFTVFQPSISQEKIAFLSHDKSNLNYYFTGNRVILRDKDILIMLYYPQSDKGKAS